MGTALTGASVIYICNEDRWNKIADEDRKRIVHVNHGMAGYISEIMQETSEKAYEQLKSNGVTISTLSEEELRKLAGKVALFEEAATELDAQGLPGKALLKRYHELAADYVSGKWKP